MPANLVTGEDARTSPPTSRRPPRRAGEDGGRLARGRRGSSPRRSRRPRTGTLDIPADPSGALAYSSAAPRRRAGQLTIDSENEASIPHNIALEGDGVNEEGEVVQDGGTSTIEVDLQPGEYTFFCSVPGHREGGMEGTLTVE